MYLSLSLYIYIYIHTYTYTYVYNPHPVFVRTERSPLPSCNALLREDDQDTSLEGTLGGGMSKILMAHKTITTADNTI